MKKTFVVLLIVMILLSFSASAEPVRLVVSGNDVPMEILEEYARELGSIFIVLNEKDNTEDLVTEALTHKDNTDLYFLSTNIDPVYIQLRDKGYLMPLEDETLLRYADALEPDFQKIVIANGQLCAIPYDALVQRTLEVDRALWAEIGLKDRAYPDTWEAFMRFMADEYPALRETHPELCAFDADYSRSLVLLAQNQLYACLSEEDTNVDSLWNAFAETLLWYRLTNWTQSYPQEDSRGARVLFSLRPEPYIHDDGAHDYMLLGMGETPGTLRVSLNLTAINPESVHKEEALALIRLMAERVPQTTRLVLMQEEHEPVLDEEVEVRWQAAQQMIEDYDKRIQAEKDAVRQNELSAERETYQQNAVEFYQKYRYIVGPDAIKRFKEAANVGYLISYSPILSHEETEVLDHLRGEMMQGNIEVGDYVHALRQRWEANLSEGY